MKRIALVGYDTFTTNGVMYKKNVPILVTDDMAAKLAAVDHGNGKIFEVIGEALVLEKESPKEVVLVAPPVSGDTDDLVAPILDEVDPPVGDEVVADVVAEEVKPKAPPKKDKNKVTIE